MLKLHSYKEAEKFGNINNVIIPILQKLDPDIEVSTTHSIHRVETNVTFGDGHTISVVDEEDTGNEPDFFYTEAMAIAKSIEYLISNK